MIARCRRFYANAGLVATAQTLLVLGFVGFVLVTGLNAGKSAVPVLAFPLAFASAYLGRTVLIIRPSVTTVILRFMFFAVLIVGVSAKSWLPVKEPWFPWALFALLGLYMGAFFWFLSDERVVRLRS